MERINTPKPRGMNRTGLRLFGMLFVVMGILGKGLIQNRMLGMGTADTQQLLEILSTEAGMAGATIALVLQAMESLAAPVFCFLLVDGVMHTQSFAKYFARVAGVALISELPYNLAMTGKVLDFSDRNPVFGLVLGMVLLYFYRRFADKGFKNAAIKVLLTLAGLVWAGMLHITDGACCVILVAVLWWFRHKPLYRNIMGCTAAFACCLFNPFYMASPMSFLMLHYYNGEKGAENRVFNYLVYPLLLLSVGLVSKFLF